MSAHSSGRARLEEDSQEGIRNPPAKKAFLLPHLGRRWGVSFQASLLHRPASVFVANQPNHTQRETPTHKKTTEDKAHTKKDKVVTGIARGCLSSNTDTTWRTVTTTIATVVIIRSEESVEAKTKQAFQCSAWIADSWSHTAPRTKHHKRNKSMTFGRPPKQWTNYDKEQQHAVMFSTCMRETTTSNNCETGVVTQHKDNTKADKEPNLEEPNCCILSFLRKRAPNARRTRSSEIRTRTDETDNHTRWPGPWATPHLRVWHQAETPSAATSHKVQKHTSNRSPNTHTHTHTRTWTLGHTRTHTHVDTWTHTHTLYIYIYTVKLLSGPSLGVSKVIIWAKSMLVSGPSWFRTIKIGVSGVFFCSVIILCVFFCVQLFANFLEIAFFEKRVQKLGFPNFFIFSVKFLKTLFFRFAKTL